MKQFKNYVWNEASDLIGSNASSNIYKAICNVSK